MAPPSIPTRVAMLRLAGPSGMASGVLAGWPCTLFSASAAEIVERSRRVHANSREVVVDLDELIGFGHAIRGGPVDDGRDAARAPEATIGGAGTQRQFRFVAGQPLRVPA